MVSCQAPPAADWVNSRYSSDVTFFGFEVKALATWTTNHRGPLAGSLPGM